MVNCLGISEITCHPQAIEITVDTYAAHGRIISDEDGLRTSVIGTHGTSRAREYSPRRMVQIDHYDFLWFCEDKNNESQKG
ncbi:hypothetical protein NUBL13784_00650 [Klebsiella pneumoniae]|nr:hypothetical protein NUBL13784_00650 [Klebsiella pneumoniae]GKJ00582.1 hypothetical protein NUBL21978_35960 [Klebsiella pneumoniae]GKK48927.1 hypothetical protein NUBL21987_42300 [Klebsiella pneumoniae]GKN35112.1 hypothetical protein NUBL22001_42310 [Klebsiella pneumoniae]GKP77663.1 hypothetical protein NUBL8594_14850 [Klebsiella pneumoniae]